LSLIKEGKRSGANLQKKENRANTWARKSSRPEKQKKTQTKRRKTTFGGAKRTADPGCPWEKETEK